MRDVWTDLLIGARLFRRAPGLAAGVALTIGLGVGAGVTILGLLHDTLVGQSPFHDPGGLVVIENTGRYYYEGRLSEGLASPRISGPDWESLESRCRTVSALGAFTEISGVLAGGDRPRPVWRTLVSPQVFAILAATPVLGRVLDDGDFRAGAAPAAVLTESLWRRHFAADREVIGRSIHLDDQPFTVVGVVPDAVLRHLRQPEGLLDQVQDRHAITPLLPGMAGGEAGLVKFLRQQRDAPWLSVIGRLAAGQTLASVQSEMSVVAGGLSAEYPASHRNRGLQARRLEAWRTARVRGTTTMLLVAALLVFLVSSFNASGLILAESVRHETETAVRQALGAGPARLVRLEVVRATLLALPGGVVGLALAGIALLAADRALAGGTGSILRTLVVPRVGLAAAAITALAGVIAGAAAAWTLRRNVAEALKTGGPTVSAGRRRQVATRALVALQVAAAVALVLATGLMLRSVRNIVAIDLGFDVAHSLVVQVRLPASRYPTGADQRRFFQQTLGRVRALPGVESAGVAATAPMTGTSMVMSGVAIEMPGGEARKPERINAQPVMPGYLEALNIRLVRGRWFDDRDIATGQAVLVDQAFARKHLDGADPLQARIRISRSSVPIVGIVGDVRRDGPLSEPVDMVYMLEPFARPAKWSYLVVRASGDPEDLGAAVLREVLGSDPAVSTDDPQAVSALFADTFATKRRLLALVGGAAAVAVLLMAFSLASTFGQFVSARRREIAIRLALGAERRHVAALLGGHVAAALGTGLVAGAGVGLALARALSAELFGVTPADPLTFVQSLIVLAVLASVAAIAPTWRAARIDPTTAMRAQ
jgi:predicted permease